MSNCLDIQPELPQLTWLGAQSDLFDDAFALSVSRDSTAFPADPFYEAQLGQKTYTSPGQREAVRALLQSPPDLTLIANLPTGSGKSALAQLPPMQRREGFLALVLLPTVALALDQERRMNELFSRQNRHWEPRPLAYHGGLSKAERASIFQGLREGQQRVLFTSPEAATGTLRKALLESAVAGRLTDIVVDEAHIIASWGSGFRPAFQLIPALIRTLRAATPNTHFIRVTLASATLTQHTMEVLQQQFGGAASTEVVSAVYLRPEPRYSSRYCGKNEAQRRAWVLDALRVAPRPFILYVTRPKEANHWLQVLRENGFARVAAFTGETEPSARQQLLEQWGANELDGMVATSAFGLGVDKADVRTIVHATLPESLDRFYQEVGRSGRDGLASASLLLFTDKDIAQASRMRAKTYIGNEIGYDRWMTMVRPSFQLDSTSSEWWVDLNAVRPKLHTRGPANRRWNLRTLNLMAQAGFLELTQLSSHDPRIPSEQVADESFDHELAYAAVRFLAGNHRERQSFDALANQVRQAHENSGQAAFEALLDLAHGRTSVELGLAKLYGLSGVDHWTPVDSLCGGCAKDWGTRPRTPLKPRPLVGRLSRFDTSRQIDWPSRLPRATQHLAIIALDDVTEALCNTRLLAALMSQVNPHTLMLAKDAGQMCETAVLRCLAHHGTATFFDRFSSDEVLSLSGGSGETRIVCWTSASMSLQAIQALWSAHVGFTVLLIGRQIPDPGRPDRSLVSVMPNSDHSDFLRAITQ